MFHWLKKLIEAPRFSAPEARPEDYLTSFFRKVKECDSTPDLIELTADYSGYVREAAIRRCGELDRVEFLLPVAARLNDWVPQVRAVARSTIMNGIQAAPPAAILAILPLTVRLLDAGRTTHHNWVAQFEQEVIRIVPVSELIAGMNNRDVHIARAIFRILKNYELLEISSLIKFGLGQRGDIILANEAIGLCSQLPDKSKRHLYHIGMRSHFGLVRTIALQVLLDLESADVRKDIAIAALVDPQSTVRAFAMAYLNTLQFDLGGYYRKILQIDGASARQCQVALASLASLRNIEDTELIIMFTGVPSTTVRLAAFVAWARLDGKNLDRIAEMAVRDRAMRVRKFGAQLVLKHGAYLPHATARAALQDSDPALLTTLSDAMRWG